MTRPDTAFVTDLAGVLGEQAVLRGADAAAHVIEDSGSPAAHDVVVVRPATTADVSRVVIACASAGVAIVPQGGNTGLSRGTESPTDRPSIVVSLSRMNRIESVDPERSTMTAQAGVTVQALQEAAEEVGRQFAPDWGARGSATIGGAVATDAGGNNVVRYGTMRDHVMGLEVVLADGRIWDGRRSLRKDASGYDLKHLFIGAEGTLGIVTSAVVRLVPATPHRQSALAAITGLDDLMPLLALAQSSRSAALTAFELVPDVGLERVCEVHGSTRPIETRSPYYILVKYGSTEPVTDLLTEFLTSGADAGHVIDAVVAATPEQEAALWNLRDELPPTRIWPEFQQLGLKLDVAVPIDRIAPFIDRITSLAADLAPMALCYGFGHVGDGNIHMMILPTADDTVDAFTAVRPALEAAVDDLVFELDGTLSAEHGLGLLLRDRIAPQKQAIEWELMRAIKATLDPGELFNPGKTLPPP